jgi:hypothetical protein
MKSLMVVARHGYRVEVISRSFANAMLTKNDSEFRGNAGHTVKTDSYHPSLRRVE